MANILNLMPNLEPDEMAYVHNLVQNMTEPQAQQFANIYNARRKGPQVILVATLVGFVFVGGVQRFLVGQIGMGLLYFFTGGLCFIGTIVDVINHRKLAFEHNIQEARYVQALVLNQAGNGGPLYYS